MTIDNDLQAWRAHQRTDRDFVALGHMLYWDQNTHMPPEAQGGRARQMALISSLHHRHATERTHGERLERLQKMASEGALSDTELRTLALAQKQFDQSSRLSGEFVARRAEHWGNIYNAWTAARPRADFAALVPLLERSLELTHEGAAPFLEGEKTAHDHYVDEGDEGMSAAEISRVFEDLRRELVPLLEGTLAAQAEGENPFAGRQISAAAQLAFGEMVVRDFGYRWSEGRQDLSPHPFMTRMGDHDARITTRVREDDPFEALYSSLHEAGHAMYEQNISPEHHGTLLAQGVSFGVHESQSRLWENIVGRSAAFWQAYGGDFCHSHGLPRLGHEALYRHANRVSAGLIRTDADELSYNLHVIVRFQLEADLLSGKLAVADLADAWQAAYEENLGTSAPTHSDGVLQDVHWFSGPLAGAFQGYTLGNIMSGQFYAAAERSVGDLAPFIAQRDFSPLLNWLTENVYTHGARFAPAELLQRATGEGLSAAPYLAYLQRKYNALNGTSL